MSLANVAYVPFLTWANPTITSLEEQALVPILSEEPIELGLKGHDSSFLDAVGRDLVYQGLFPQAFPGQDDIYTIPNVTKAIAAFERTIVWIRSLPLGRRLHGNLRCRQAWRASLFLKRARRLVSMPRRMEFQRSDPIRRKPDPRGGFLNSGVSTHSAQRTSESSARLR
jgi:hypothetical protein